MRTSLWLLGVLFLLSSVSLGQNAEPARPAWHAELSDEVLAKVGIDAALYGALRERLVSAARPSRYWACVLEHEGRYFAVGVVARRMQKGALTQSRLDATQSLVATARARVRLLLALVTPKYRKLHRTGLLLDALQQLAGVELQGFTRAETRKSASSATRVITGIMVQAKDVKLLQANLPAPDSVGAVYGTLVVARAAQRLAAGDAKATFALLKEVRSYCQQYVPWYLTASEAFLSEKKPDLAIRVLDSARAGLSKAMTARHLERAGDLYFGCKAYTKARGSYKAALAALRRKK